MRPRSFEELVGQSHLLSPGSPLALMRDGTHLSSLILWGPPGSGKTTLAFVIRRLTSAHFEAMSAVLSGVKELREVLRAAEERRRREGRQRRQQENNQGAHVCTDRAQCFARPSSCRPARIWSYWRFNPSWQPSAPE